MNLTPYILPTDSSSLIFKDNNGKIFHSINMDQEQGHFKPNHLYLCSTEDPKEGEWVYNEISKEVYKFFKNHANCEKKIHFTTYPALIADGVQKIDGDTKAPIKKYGQPYSNGSRYRQDLIDTEGSFLTEFCKRWNDKGEAKESFSLEDIEDAYKMGYRGDTLKEVMDHIKSNILSPSLSISYNTETRSLTIK